MKIGLVTTHSFPTPYKIHTGDIVIIQLAEALHKLGHSVNLYAPDGSFAKGATVYPMPCSYGKYPPRGEDCEQSCFDSHKEVLLSEDIVHDFSVHKTIANNLFNLNRKVICTLMGGAWTQPQQPHNLCVWSQSHRNRVLRGATDYENTPTPDVAGPSQTPVNEAHVVSGGVDTNFYCPNSQNGNFTYKKDNYFLWMNRWHPAKGYKQAIDIARYTKINLVMAGEHPDNECFEYQKNCALEAVEYAKGLDNVKFNWLPKDPDHHTAKRSLYRSAQALLYTVQFNEPFGLSQTEALACGTPVIGTNYGSVPELIVNGQVGFVRENDILKLSNAIYMNDIIKPETCRRVAAEKYDIAVMAKSYLKEYEKILNNQSW